MKIGLVGYRKPEIESLLQAYAVKKFLEPYHIESGFSLSYAQVGEEDKKLEQFLVQKIGIINREDITTFLMVNDKAFADMYDTKAAFRDYYQRTYDESDIMVEALLLATKDEYERLIDKEQVIEKEYLFIDSISDCSSLATAGRKYAAKNKIDCVCRYQDKRYKKSVSKDHLDPGSYINLIKNASGVITDNFMTLFFAILYEKPIVVQDSMLYPGKCLRFLKRLGLKSCYVKTLGDNLSVKSEKVDWNEVHKKLHQMITEASNYLFDCIPSMNEDSVVDAPMKLLHTKCYGCFACKVICPVSAIKMIRNQEGFYYPQANESCINCGKCTDVCIKINQPQTVSHEEGYPKVFAAYNKNIEERMLCTSGGVIPLLAEHIIGKKQGVIFGAVYDENLRIKMDMAESMDSVTKQYSFKYAKANLTGTFEKVKEVLETGREVIYVGLPCECAGLKATLGKEYENLLLIDLLCDHIPSPKVFEKYTDYISKKYGSKLKNLRFRDKKKGWVLHKAALIFEFEDREPIYVNARRNNYFRNCMKHNLAMSACADCDYTGRNRVGDLTLGDFNGIDKIEPSMFDNKGTSMVLVNTEKGLNVIREIKTGLTLKTMTLGQAFKYTPKKPIKLTNERHQIFERLDIEPIDNLLELYNDLK